VRAGRSGLSLRQFVQNNVRSNRQQNTETRPLSKKNKKPTRARRLANLKNAIGPWGAPIRRSPILGCSPRPRLLFSPPGRSLAKAGGRGLNVVQNNAARRARRDSAVHGIRSVYRVWPEPVSGTTPPCPSQFLRTASVPLRPPILACACAAPRRRNFRSGRHH